MTTDHSKQHYYGAVGSKGSDFGPYWARVYHYDPTGDKEIDVWRSPKPFRNKEDAEDAAASYCEENGIDAEMC